MLASGGARVRLVILHHGWCALRGEAAADDGAGGRTEGRVKHALYAGSGKAQRRTTHNIRKTRGANNQLSCANMYCQRRMKIIWKKMKMA